MIGLLPKLGLAMTQIQQALQDQYAKKSICFGCGPSNDHGLQLKSFVAKDSIIARFTPKPFHHAFPKVLNGGIIGALFDCHANWAACYYLMQAQSLDTPPCTVTRDFSVQLKRPTPMDHELFIEAKLERIEHNKAFIHANLSANDILCAEFTGCFVQVKEDHPAYHRW